MEERRRFLEDNGHFIRKINQAFFAFHGSYATSAASVSPIDEQLRELQSRSDSLEEFVKTVSTFGTYQEFLEHLVTERETDQLGSVIPSWMRGYVAVRTRSFRSSEVAPRVFAPVIPAEAGIQEPLSAQ